MRTLSREVFGNFLVSYIFFRFYANLNLEENKSYESPSVTEQIKNLNKKNFYLIIGKKLAEIALDIITNINKDIDLLDDKKKELISKFEKIIGNEYANILAKELLDNLKIIEENEKEKNIPILSEKIIDILLGHISGEFEKYLKDLDYQSKYYKDQESGNVAEFLLFNNFGETMSLKQCMFLLDENNYKNTNIFNFRINIKELKGKRNDEFLEKITAEKNIFHSLFSDYKSIYSKISYDKNIFTTEKKFRNFIGDNLDKEYEYFDCHLFKSLPKFENESLNQVDI